LNKLAGAQRIYLIMLGDAGQKAKSYRFTVAHPDSFEVMRVSHDVSGAFTSDGWKVMDANILNSKRFLQGEPWVLGAAATYTNLSPAELSQDLKNLYEKDFIQQWRAFLTGARILPYKDDADAALKLKKFSSNSAPVLALICDISDNTNVVSSPIKLAFQAPQQVVSPGCGAQSKYAQPSNAQYMTALLNLQQCAQEVADAPLDQKDAKKAQCSQTANQALLAAQQIEQALPNDSEGHVDKIAGALLEEPIRAFLKVAGEGPGTDAMCKPYRILQALYPFNAHGKRDATLQEFNAFFQPGTGQLSQFLSTHKGAMALQGTKFVASSGGLASAGSRLLGFVNEMYPIQQAVYPSNAQEPHFEYSVTGHLPEAGGYQSERLNFDGQELAVTGAGATKKFIWPGITIQSATLSLNSGPGDLEVQREQGLWAVARFFAGYKWQPAGSAISIQGPLLGPTGQPQRINGKNVEVRFEVDFKGVPFFQVGRLSQYGCPANVKQ
jgi:type VI secretion system protein ImpL